MSEKEIIRRQEYKKNRKKWLLVQAVALALAVAIALCSFVVYDQMNKTYYIEYTEGSSIDYQVRYQENDFSTYTAPFFRNASSAKRCRPAHHTTIIRT